MKKLLALVLCTMLFVSVIPTSAFADSPEKIDLKPAVDQMNHLYAAYSEFAGKNVVANIYNGFKALGEQYPEGSKARYEVEHYILQSKAYNSWWKTLEKNANKGIAYSPEGLFNRYARNISIWYDWVGIGIVRDTNAKIAEKEAKMEADIGAEIDKLNASVAAAMASALAQIPAAGGHV